MPETPSHGRSRQSARGSKRASNKPSAGTIGMQKVTLPDLKGTASSRKQYSYGAAEEPVAPHRLMGERNPAPLYGKAQYEVGEELGDDSLNMEKALSYAMMRQADEETRGAAVKPSPKSAAKPAAQRKPRQTRGDADTDDELASAAFPPPLPNQSTQSTDFADDRSFRLESDVFGDAAIASTVGNPSPAPEPQSARKTGKYSRTKQAKTARDPTYRDTPAEDELADAVATAPLQVSPSTTKKSKSKVAKDPSFKNVMDDASSSDNEDGVAEPAGILEASSSRRKARATKDATFRDAGDSSSDEQTPSRRRTRSKRKQQKTVDAQADLSRHPNGSARQPVDGSDEDWQLEMSKRHAFRQAVANGVRAKRPNHFGSDLSEQDSAFQEDIHKLDAECRRREMEEEKARRAENRRQRFRHAKTTVSIFFANAQEAIILFCQRAWPIVWRIMSLLVAGFLLYALYPLFENIQLSRPSSWDFHPLEAVQNFASVVKASMPSFSKPDWKKILDESDFDSDGKISVDAFLDKYATYIGQIDSLKTTVYQQQQFLTKINKALPKVVALELDDNKNPVIAQEFYLALLDIVETDSRYIVLDKDGHLSDKRRQIMTSELLQDGQIDGRISRRVEAAVDGATSEMEDRLTTKWDAWVKRNDAKIEHIKDGRAQDAVLVDREAILARVRTDLNQQRLEAQTDLRRLSDQVKAEIQEKLDSMDLANNPVALPDTVTRAEVDDIISNALANMEVEAFARTQIQNGWETKLKNKVNFFSVGSGAIINENMVSQDYRPRRSSGVRTLANVVKTPQVALRGWEEDGDSWCAAKGRNPKNQVYGYQFGVILREPVIPEHIVVEHILPGATIDPDARPKDIEVWIAIEDPDIRELVKNWEASNLPPVDPNEDLAELPNDYVRIARYKYQGAELYDGKHHQPLDPELKTMGADTQNVVIRAVTNYGAANHTCFYRVRMYGESTRLEIIDEVIDAAEEKTWWQFW